MFELNGVGAVLQQPFRLTNAKDIFFSLFCLFVSVCLSVFNLNLLFI